MVDAKILDVNDDGTYKIRYVDFGKTHNHVAEQSLYPPKYKLNFKYKEGDRVSVKDVAGHWQYAKILEVLDKIEENGKKRYRVAYDEKKQEVDHAE